MPVFRIRKEDDIYHYDLWGSDENYSTMDLVESIRLSEGCSSVEYWIKKSATLSEDYDLERDGLGIDDFFIVLRGKSFGIFTSKVIVFNYKGEAVQGLDEDDIRIIRWYSQASKYSHPYIGGEEYVVCGQSLFGEIELYYLTEVVIKVKEKENGLRNEDIEDSASSISDLYHRA